MNDGTSRRSFLAWSGAAAGATVSAQLLGPLAAEAEPGTGPGPAAQKLADAALYMRRPADQCVLVLALWNMAPDFSVSPPVLKKLRKNETCYLAVEFGGVGSPAPQHVTEAAFPLQDDLDGSVQKHPPHKPPKVSQVGAVPVATRAAGKSRLAFVIPDSRLGTSAAHPLTIDTASLLDWLSFVLSVTGNAIAPFGLDAFGRGPTGLGAPVEPLKWQTGIEMPYGVVLSPPAYLSTGAVGPFTGSSVFINATDPVTHNGWTELWHTRLASKHLVIIGRLGALLVDENARDLRTVRAVWCTDSTFAQDVHDNKTHVTDNDPGFTGSLLYQDRYDIVRLSSDFTPASKGGPYKRSGTSQSGAPLASPFVPSSATVDRMMLTALGGWLDAEAHWDLPHATRNTHKKPKDPVEYNSSLIAWRHRLVQGRDSYVRVVRKGFLFPWGHRASLVTVTDREPTQVGNGVGAYLRQKTFIIVGQPTKSYGGAGDFAPHDGRRIPFQSVQALTLVTPDLKKPAHFLELKNQFNEDELVFQPMIDAKTPFQFHLRGFDWAGAPIDFRSPVVFIDDTVAYGDSSANKKLMDRVMFRWSHPAGKAEYPSIDLHNQRVSVAEPKNPDQPAGDTQLVITSFELGYDHPVDTGTGVLASASQPAFYPALHTMLVDMPQAKSASGNSVGQPTFEYEPDRYLTYGFQVKSKHGKVLNKGGVILRRVAATERKKITFRGDKSGGAVTPNLGLDGFSREIGPLSAAQATLASDMVALAKGTFNPQSVFDGVDAKILGGIELQAILKQVNFGDGNNDQALQLTSIEKHNPHRIVTTLDWHPVIQDGGPRLPKSSSPVITIFKVSTSPDPASDSMDLNAVIVTSLDPNVPSVTTVVGQIRDFEIDLFGDSGPTYFIRIPFDSLTFHARTGHKTDVQVQISDEGIQFQGALSFVQDLATYLNFDGSGLVINTAGSAITAVLTLSIPTIGLGVFALENLAFSAGVAIPYNGDPVRFDFAFCSRDNPFQLEIMMFTGGGFVGLGVGADGVELLEFSFDFGLGYSIDVGVASGQVSLVGGVYFESQTLPSKKQDVQLTAYVKASGGVSALGIVSVSVELYLSLGYESVGGQSSLIGTAEMSISVHVLFFGATIGFSISESFGGSGTSSNAIGAAHPAALEPHPSNHFGDSMTQDNWTDYCASFALIGVGD
ncbi:MAG TPA: hypothetical protein VGH30_09410 [Jatrophihabitantaceae bacterium]